VRRFACWSTRGATGTATLSSAFRVMPSRLCHRLCQPAGQRVGTTLANVAFILADLYEDSEFTEPSLSEMTA